MTKRTGLTDVSIKNLKTRATRYEERDYSAPGLRVVVQPSGVKSFAVRYELKGGKSVKLTLGRWVPPEDRKETKSAKPKIGDALSLGQARVLAADARNKVLEGIDPAGQKREAKVERAQVIKELRATFSAAPGLEACRPFAETKIAGFFLAGDWTHSGWPATMEGAVRSGYLAAEAVSAAAGKPAKFLLPDIA